MYILDILNSKKDIIFNKLTEKYTSCNLEVKDRSSDGLTVFSQLKRELISGKNMLIKSYEVLQTDPKKSIENIDFLLKINQYKEKVEENDKEAKQLAYEIIEEYLLPPEPAFGTPDPNEFYAKVSHINVPDQINLIQAYKDHQYKNIPFDQFWSTIPDQSLNKNDLDKYKLFDVPYNETIDLVVKDMISTNNITSKIFETISGAIEMVIYFVLCYYNMTNPAVKSTFDLDMDTSKLLNIKKDTQLVLMSIKCDEISADEVISIFMELFDLDGLFTSKNCTNCIRYSEKIFKGYITDKVKMISSYMALRIIDHCDTKKHNIDVAKERSKDKINVITKLAASKNSKKVAPMNTPIKNAFVEQVETKKADAETDVVPYEEPKEES